MDLSPEELESRILVEEVGLVVVDKPPDLPTSGRSLDDPDCLQHALIARRGGMVWAVHQLDADTSGVNLFTTERRQVEPLKRALAAGTKRYLAVVHGTPAWTARDCDAPLGPLPEDPRTLGVVPEAQGGRAAHSSFEVAVRAPDHSWIEATIETGRTHQIRIHLAHLGHPLVGEEWYRDPPCMLHARQALHAAWISLDAERGPLRVTAPIPPDLIALGERLGLSPPAVPRS